MIDRKSLENVILEEIQDRSIPNPSMTELEENSAIDPVVTQCLVVVGGLSVPLTGARFWESRTRRSRKNCVDTKNVTLPLYHQKLYGATLYHKQANPLQASDLVRIK